MGSPLHYYQPVSLDKQWSILTCHSQCPSHAGAAERLEPGLDIVDAMSKLKLHWPLHPSTVCLNCSASRPPQSMRYRDEHAKMMCEFFPSTSPCSTSNGLLHLLCLSCGDDTSISYMPQPGSRGIFQAGDAKSTADSHDRSAS